MSTGTPTSPEKVDETKDKIEITKQQLAQLPEVVAVHGKPGDTATTPGKAAVPEVTAVSPELNALQSRVAEAQKALKGYDLKVGRLRKQCREVGTNFQQVKDKKRELDEPLVVQIEQLAAIIRADNAAQPSVEPRLAKLKERASALKSEKFQTEIEAADAALVATDALSWVDVQSQLPKLEQQVEQLAASIRADNAAQLSAEPRLAKLKERASALKSEKFKTEIEAADAALVATDALSWVDVQSQLPKLEQQVYAIEQKIHAAEFEVAQATAKKLSQDQVNLKQQAEIAKGKVDSMYVDGRNASPSTFDFYRDKLAKVPKTVPKGMETTVAKYKAILAQEPEYKRLVAAAADAKAAFDECTKKLAEAQVKEKALASAEEERLRTTYSGREPFLDKRTAITDELDAIDERREKIDESPTELRASLQSITDSVWQSHDYESAMTQLEDLSRKVEAEKLALINLELEYKALLVRQEIDATETPSELTGTRLESANSQRAALLTCLEAPLELTKINEAKTKLPAFKSLLDKLLKETRWETQAKKCSEDLGAIKDPEHLAEFPAKKTRVEAARTKASQLINGQLNDKTVQQAIKAVADLKALVVAIQGEIVREQKAALLLQQLAAISDPVGLAENAAKLAQLTTARSNIQTQLAAPENDEVLTAAAQAITKYKSLVETTDGELKLARLGVKLTNELADAKDPDNLAQYPDLKKSLDDLRAAVLAKLQAPVSRTRVSEVESTLLPQFKTAIEETSAKILLEERGKKVRVDAAAIAWPAGLSQNKIKFAELQKTRAETLTPLVAPLTLEAVEAAEKRLEALREQLKKLATELESEFLKLELAKRAEQVKQQLDSIVDPPELADDAARKDKVNAARTDILIKLKAPLDEAVVLAAFKALPAFEELVEQVVPEINQEKAPQTKLDYDAFEKRYLAVQPNCEARLKTTMANWFKEIGDLMTAQKSWLAGKRIALFSSSLDFCKKISDMAELAKLQDSLTAKLVDPVKTNAKTEIGKALATIDAVADLDGASKQLTDCEAAFEAASTLVQTALKTVARQMETSDGGHSMDRHGPDVTDDQLKKRLEQGIAADGVLSPTHTSTKFDEVEYWIETRDKALAKMLTESGLANLTTDPGSELKKYSLVIEHNKPIDTGFVADEASRSEIVMKDASGEPEYELDNGNKRWVRNASGIPLDAKGNPVECDDSVPPLPLDERGVGIHANDHATVTKWKGEEPVLRVKTFKVYSAHTKVSGLTRTTTTVVWDGSKWKVVQHFPNAEGWDDVNKRYTIPLPT